MSDSCIIKLLHYAQVRKEKCDLIGINGLNQTTDLEVKWAETNFTRRKSNKSLQNEQQ